jgi:hypothetical protein
MKEFGKLKIALSLLIAASFMLPLAGNSGSGQPLEPSQNPWDALTQIPELDDHSWYWNGEIRDKSPGLVYVLVQPMLYGNLSSYITRYMQDLTSEGYVAELHIEGWLSASAVRNLLISGYAAGMQGTVLIGSIPYARYEIADDFNQYGYCNFPIDLYYMDLDGSWVDGNPLNGIFDNHLAGSGDIEADIWLGRIYAGSVTIPGQTETSLVQNYLDRNHAYRMGNISLLNRSLVYVDDDWEPYANDWSNDVGMRYSNRTLVKDLETTRCLDYKTRFDDNYDWIALFSHSGDYYHAMKFSSGGSWDYCMNYEISSANPVAHFYNLFCCHGANYSYSADDGYLAGHYVFSQNGLGAVGSTKTGSMLNFYDFYGPLGNGNSLGEAFLEWFALNAETGAGSQFESRCWFYGMTLIGDPTLVTYDIVKPLPPTDLRISISGGSNVLTWTAAPQDDINHYHVYRSNDPYNFDFATPYHDTDSDPSPLATTYADVGAGSDANSWYYVVRAVDMAMNEDSNTEIVGKFHRPAGQTNWNLVSVPLQQWDTSIDQVFLNSNWDYMMAYGQNDWQSFANFRPESQNDLTDADHTMGVWVHQPGPAGMIFLGKKMASSQITLKAGWNLVGYPTIEPSSVEDALAGTGYDAVETFDASSTYMFRAMADSEMMQPGNGYWVHVPADMTWTVNW